MWIGETRTWRVMVNLPHVGVLVQAGARPRFTRSIGQGARDEPLSVIAGQATAAHCRWRASSGIDPRRGSRAPQYAITTETLSLYAPSPTSAGSAGM